MKYFKHINNFIIIIVLLNITACNKKISEPTPAKKTIVNLNLSASDTILFNYHVGDTVIFSKYKSTLKEELKFIVIFIRKDTLHEQRNYGNFEIKDIYMECMHYKFKDMKTDSITLDLYKMGNSATTYLAYSVSIDFKNMRYHMYDTPRYDTLVINNLTYRPVHIAVSYNLDFFPINCHILLNYKDGIIRIRPSIDEIWDLVK
ncbi:MAG: hypothetical protein Q8M15_00195 [Bacteroidota bacterium]|nr:hypothetical protein [Bacteroidota bacterium]